MKCSHRKCRMYALRGHSTCWNHTKDPRIVEKRRRARLKGGKHRRSPRNPIRNDIAYLDWLQTLPLQARKEVKAQGGASWFMSYQSPRFWSQSTCEYYPFPLNAAELEVYRQKERLEQDRKDQLAKERAEEEAIAAKEREQRLAEEEAIRERKQTIFPGKPPKHPKDGQYWLNPQTKRWMEWRDGKWHESSVRILSPAPTRLEPVDSDTIPLMKYQPIPGPRMPSSGSSEWLTKGDRKKPSKPEPLDPDEGPMKYYG